MKSIPTLLLQRGRLRIFPLLLLAFFAASSCSQKEEEQELDYDHMVMLEEEDEWSPGPESDGKEIVDLDLQESIIQDPELKTENGLEEIR